MMYKDLLEYGTHQVDIVLDSYEPSTHYYTHINRYADVYVMHSVSGAIHMCIDGYVQELNGYVVSPLCEVPMVLSTEDMHKLRILHASLDREHAYHRQVCEDQRLSSLYHRETGELYPDTPWHVPEHPMDFRPWGTRDEHGMKDWWIRDHGFPETITLHGYWRDPSGQIRYAKGDDGKWAYTKLYDKSMPSNIENWLYTSVREQHFRGATLIPISSAINLKTGIHECKVCKRKTFHRAGQVALKCESCHCYIHKYLVKIHWPWWEFPFNKTAWGAVMKPYALYKATQDQEIGKITIKVPAPTYDAKGVRRGQADWKEATVEREVWGVSAVVFDWKLAVFVKRQQAKRGR
jgi:hypothetical protein